MASGHPIGCRIRCPFIRSRCTLPLVEGSKLAHGILALVMSHRAQMGATMTVVALLGVVTLSGGDFMLEGPS